jgi:hypothetical protein
VLLLLLLLLLLACGSAWSVSDVVDIIEYESTDPATDVSTEKVDWTVAVVQLFLSLFTECCCCCWTPSSSLEIGLLLLLLLLSPLLLLPSNRTKGYAVKKFESRIRYSICTERPKYPLDLFFFFP